MVGGFEGYVGIRLWDGQRVDDLVLALLIILFVCFAWVFRTHPHVFARMMGDVIHMKERENLFEDVKGNEFFFRNFMNYHALILCAVCLFLIARAEDFYSQLLEENALLSIGLISVALVLFYWGKNFLYSLFASVFTDPDKYKFWRTGYDAIVGTWGVSLYIPALLLVFVNMNVQIPILLFIFSYITSRIVIIYKTIRIFHKKNSSYLYLSLYLCGQEILPLFLLWKAMVVCITFMSQVLYGNEY